MGDTKNSLITVNDDWEVAVDSGEFDKQLEEHRAAVQVSLKRRTKRMISDESWAQHSDLRIRNWE